MLINNYHMCEDDKTFATFEVNGRLYQFTWLLTTFQRAIDKFVDEKNLTNAFVYLDNITVARRDQTEHDKCVKSFF